MNTSGIGFAGKKINIFNREARHNNAKGHTDSQKPESINAEVNNKAYSSYTDVIKSKPKNETINNKEEPFTIKEKSPYMYNRKKIGIVGNKNNEENVNVDKFHKKGGKVTVRMNSVEKSKIPIKKVDSFNRENNAKEETFEEHLNKININDDADGVIPVAVPSVEKVSGKIKIPSIESFKIISLEKEIKSLYSVN
jgi:hypothetical protein